MLPFRTVSQLQKWAELSRTRFVRRVLVSSDKAARKKEYVTVAIVSGLACRCFKVAQSSFLLRSGAADVYERS